MQFDPKQIRISDYTYDLPEEKIAKFPLKNRDHSKLLVYKGGKIWHTYFYNLPQMLPADTLLVVNNTKVVYARLIFHKPTGARIEIFLLTPAQPADYNLAFAAKRQVTWNCTIGNLRKWKTGKLTKIFTYNGQKVSLNAERIGQTGDSQTVKFTWNADLAFSEILDLVGLVPIPPYLNREAVPEDRNTYQTVYSKLEGSVAAPTAGLHFTDRVLNGLKNKGINVAEITLHVGAGTFKPVKTETIGGHSMHTEYFTVELNQLELIASKLGNITAVGTTTLRTLETLFWIGQSLENGQITNFISQWHPYGKTAFIDARKALDNIINWLKKNDLDKLEGWTQIIIVPGYKFKVVDNLITNFHQPRSTLLLLVAAFVGENWRKIYQYALENDFRFLSYGDSSLLFKRNEENDSMIQSVNDSMF